MEIPKPVERVLNRVDPRLLARLYRAAKRVPAVRRTIEAEYDKLMGDLAASIRPYQDRFPRNARLPARGRPREDVLGEMREMLGEEADRWQDGFVSGAVYHGDPAHVRFLDEVYALHSQVNPLHADLWPSGSRYESEIVAMTAHLLGASDDAPSDARVCGSVTSGGTESILLAMKAYRDRARAERGIRRPEIVVPTSAHAAFDKAGQYFGMQVRKVPVGPDWRADVGAMTRAITPRTVAVVGSAPCFPHGVIDPIGALSEVCRVRGVGFHTDACLGGFVLPFAERLGYPVPPFDFRLPGVTSLSADTHKYGYAAKGTSVVLYRGPALRRHQYFTIADWPGGLYFSPTFAGSRPGALVAAAWATMLAVGEDGYLDATRRILETAARIREGIQAIPGLRVLGDPLWVVAFDAPDLDIYRVLDAMTHRRWSLNGLHRPAAVHLCVTLRHTQPGVADRFLADLAASVEQVRQEPPGKGGMAPVYGLAGSMPVRGLVTDLLERYIDMLYDA